MRQARWMTVTGWVLSVLPALLFIMGAVMTFHPKPEMVQGFTGKYGYPAGSLPVIGAVELICALLYLFPPTAVFGAVLLAAYLGGAVSTHVRVGEAFAVPVLMGVVLWAGLFLRDERLREIFPLRRPHTAARTSGQTNPASPVTGDAVR